VAEIWGSNFFCRVLSSDYLVCYWLFVFHLIFFGKIGGYTLVNRFQYCDVNYHDHDALKRIVEM
jgi:hypothetical protein